MLSSMCNCTSNDTLCCLLASSKLLCNDNETYVEEELPLGIKDASFWIYLGVYVFLVLMAGIMSGLTMGLLSLDLLTLKILKSSGTDREKKYASGIVPIVEKHHLLLVTLLLGNAAAVEAMPLFLDKISGPIVAVVVSVTAVLIFGEIIPQAICTRYGLAIGYYFSPFVKMLMVLTFIISWPIAKLLDCLLGKEHSTFFRRAQLEELVAIHGQKNPSNEEQLTYDEVLIIKGALEMRSKVVREVMTPIESVFMVSEDDKLDEKLMKKLVGAGHSRVPVYAGVKTNLVGLLLVKNLILLDPDDAVPVRDVCRSESALPKVDHQMPLYSLLNKFQEGKSHICQVWGPKAGPVTVTAENGGRETGAHSDGDPPELLGVITLEDVIEELIQEEIVDETDVFEDVHRRILVARAKLTRSSSAEADMQEKIEEGGRKFHRSKRTKSLQTVPECLSGSGETSQGLLVPPQPEFEGVDEKKPLISGSIQ
eukprot:m.33838 g.33838  ORF g.33838 m.33838 type:complete len:481 (+) comp31920_c0_seq1:250-1692(+)